MWCRGRKKRDPRALSFQKSFAYGSGGERRAQLWNADVLDDPTVQRWDPGPAASLINRSEPTASATRARNSASAAPRSGHRRCLGKAKVRRQSPVIGQLMTPSGPVIDRLVSACYRCFRSIDAQPLRHSHFSPSHLSAPADTCLECASRRHRPVHSITSSALSRNEVGR